MLSAAPKTRRQLEDALRARGIPDAASTAVLDRFAEVGLIDDVAFAAAWVSSRQQGRGLARRALAQELRHRGVDAAVVAEAVAAVDPETEEAAARELVARRLQRMTGVSGDAAHRRLLALLARRGYSTSVAARVVREALAHSTSPG